MRRVAPARVLPSAGYPTRPAEAGTSLHMDGLRTYQAGASTLTHSAATPRCAEGFEIARLYE